MKRVFFVVTFILLLTSMLTLAFNIQPVKASGTIYIRADGSVDPPTAPISTVDNITYTFTGDIINDSIVIERDNIVVDGAGYALQGGYPSGYPGVRLSDRSNVTIKDTNIETSGIGLYLNSTVDSVISGNNIANNYWCGIDLFDSSNNKFYHNNFINNTLHEVWIETQGSANVWDEGYPSGGNYWSNHDGVDLFSGPYQNMTGSDGMGDTPHVLDVDNVDHYPLMKHAHISEPDASVTNVTSAKTIIGQGYGGNVTVTAQYLGDFTENFNVTTYANLTAIGTLNFNLTSGSTASKLIMWDTFWFSYGYGNYTLEAVADGVVGETDIEDNNYTCPVPVHVGVPGDISGPTQGVYDGTCNMRDITYLIIYFNTRPTSPNWKPNADINNDGTVNMRDITIAILNFNKHE